MNKKPFMQGISLLELLIVFAVVSIFLGATLPDPQTQLIRAKVNHSLEIANSAQQALVKTCLSDRQAVVRTNLDAEFFYLPAGTEEDYVRRIQLGADCASGKLAVMLWTTHTGAETDPVIQLYATADFIPADTRVTVISDWNCILMEGDPRHLPEGCGAAHANG